MIACRTSLAFCDCVRKMLLTFDAFGLRIKRPGFASEPLSGSVDPDVHGLDFVPLRELHVLLLDSFTQTGAGGRSHLICYYNTPEDEEGEMRAGTRLRCALDHMLHNRVRGRKKKKNPHTQKKQNKSSPIVLFFLPERGGGVCVKNRPLKKAHFQHFPIFSALATKEKATLHHPCLLIRLHLTPQMPPHSVENTRKQTASAKHTSSIHAVADRQKQVRQCYIICFLFHTHYLLTNT